MQLTAVFDIGRTNKKLLLFDEQYRVVEEISETLPETTDEDGFPCDDLPLLTRWVRDHWQQLRRRIEQSSDSVQLRAVNVAAYGATLVHIDETGQPVAPVYSYLKPFPPELTEHFYTTYGEAMTLARQTASPPMGMLNSGLHLYWLKHVRPEVWARVRWSLHLPQYISFLITGQPTSDYTSIGCHTALWDFEQHRYHDWVLREGLHTKLAPIVGQPIVQYADGVPLGGGLHDSSSVIMAYLSRCQGEFMVLSTGTWCITLNPFNTQPLTDEQLHRDCLSYLTVGGAFIKASRLFMGREHDYQVARIAEHFNLTPDFSRQVPYRADLVERLRQSDQNRLQPACMAGTGPFPNQPPGDWDVSAFASAEEAYTRLMIDLVELLTISIKLIDQNTPTIYVDGGFARSQLFMQLLANRFPEKAVYTSLLPQATAIGAALYIRQDDEPVAGWTFERVLPTQEASLPTATQRS
ncbi:carbohydrate kinase FGGY [Fibrisoma limi BUZ 3]|uniref:Carbohydrate kinase FGGY n=1 Tax=Fibrisoma limi BUZ 3 TaxID=1185876 RepID=I2GLA2_9BACT|nr:FGGY family carbohydrate kinase [Fibrisoma limi]CCH54678.1 carbohydrate kinase FGGY [Fibrisoma limi BUZ 3]